MDGSRLLDIRLFDEQREIRLFRSNIGMDFHFKYIDDSLDYPDNKKDYYDDVYYLDIDDTYNNRDNDIVRATGGGKYELPIENKKNAGIKMRYYIQKNEVSGIAEVVDSRAVKFVEV